MSSKRSKKTIKDKSTSRKPAELSLDSFDETSLIDGKNPAAVLLGRIGGLKGGKARAAKLSSERRSEIARNAAKARWAKK